VTTKRNLSRRTITQALAGTAMIMASFSVAAPAFAQQDAQAEAADFNIAAGPLGAVLTQFAKASGYQLLYQSDLVDGKTSPGFNGRAGTVEALARVLAGTGLTFQVQGGRTIQIERAAEGSDSERVLGAVRVEGQNGSPYFGGAGQAAGVNGINGSRDITATEGTGSFTSGALTIGSKVAQSLKDVPQSISVLTNERLEQQNVTDFTSAMRQLPGVTLTQSSGSSSLETTFLSRGFPVTSIQIDGGAPLQTGGGFFPMIDMSMYDHVELLRGAAGLFNGYGNPGGTVNLVRKKPLDHPQYILEAQAGSWSNYRMVADASTPLALDGKLRGRLVTTYQNNRHFYKIAKDNKTLIYGVVELDVTPTTLVSGGINYTEQHSLPFMNGLPRYWTGADLHLPRSTCLCLPWSRWNFATTEVFSNIEQKLSNDWTLKLNLTRNRQESARKIGYSTMGINPDNMQGGVLGGYYDDYASKQLSMEATFAGHLTIFGQRQEITIGFNRVSSDSGGRVTHPNLTEGTALNPYQPYPGGPLYYYGSPAGTWVPTGNPFNFDPNNPLFAEPRTPPPFARSLVDKFTQMGAYISVRLTAFDRLHMTTGFRWSRYKSEYLDQSICGVTNDVDQPQCYGKNVGYVFGSTKNGSGDDDVSGPPPINLSFDITKNLTAYVGYTDIYIQQPWALDTNEKVLDPITGANWEGGIKWNPRGGKINIGLSGFRIRQDGFGEPDFTRFFGEIRPGVICCYKVDVKRFQKSSGYDLDVTGEVLPGLQLAASYVYNETTNENNQTFVSIQPKHLYKIWMTYDFGAGGKSGALSGLSISGGVNGQSSGYESGTVCVNPTGPAPGTGPQDCTSYDLPDYVPYSFEVVPYAVISGRIDYKISNRWSLSVNLENILDKTYYQSIGGPSGNNWYGNPRSVTATLRAKW
jgi:outer-membrane receptor for ferric coprogen and ferric-rhodotorulic acid